MKAKVQSASLRATINRTCRFGIGILLLLCSPSCSGQENGRAYQDYSSNEKESDWPSHQSPRGERTVEGIPRISIDIIAALFPATALDAHNMTELSGLFGRIFDLHFVECMREAGFDLDPATGEPSDRYFDFPDLDSIATDGFGVMLSLQSPNEWLDPLQVIPRELQTQYAIDQKSCYEAYVEAFGDPMSQVLKAAAVLQDQWYGELAEIDYSPEMISEFQVWRECMAEGGRPVDSHRGFFAEIDGILFELSHDFDAALAVELEAAELYVACMEPLEAVRQPIRDEARRMFLEDNAEEIRAIEELADRLIQEAQEQQQQ